MRTIEIIQHGAWETVITEIESRFFNYTVTTRSNFCPLQPQTFCRTLEQAKKAAARHAEEVKGII